MGISGEEISSPERLPQKALAQFILGIQPREVGILPCKKNVAQKRWDLNEQSLPCNTVYIYIYICMYKYIYMYK